MRCGTIGCENRLADFLALAKRLDFVGIKLVDWGEAGIVQPAHGLLVDHANVMHTAGNLVDRRFDVAFIFLGFAHRTVP